MVRTPPAWALLLLATLLSAAGFATEEPDAADASHGFAPSPPPAADPLGGLAALTLNATALRHHGGEAAVGLCSGAVAGWVLRKVQGAVVMLAVVGGAGTAAALHLEWVTQAQVQRFASMLFRVVQDRVRALAQQADLDNDDELTLEDSKLALSKVTPALREHPAMAAGFAGGFVAALGTAR